MSGSPNRDIRPIILKSCATCHRGENTGNRYSETYSNGYETMVDKVSNHGFRAALMKIMNDDHKPFT